MSNEYNAAGKSLVVDEITELHPQSRQTSGDIKRIADAQLAKRDLARIKAEIGEMTSDDVLTPSEKSILYREWKTMQSSHALYSSQAESYGMKEQQVYVSYAQAYLVLDDQLGDVLHDLTTPSDISGAVLKARFDAYYGASSLLDEEFFTYTTGLLQGLDDRTKFTLILYAAPLPAEGTTTIHAQLLDEEGQDVSADYDGAEFSWKSRTEGTTQDTDEGTGKALDVSETGAYMCTWKHSYSETMYYMATQTITVVRDGYAGKDGKILNLSLSSHVFTVSPEGVVEGESVINVTGQGLESTPQVMITANGSDVTYTRTRKVTPAHLSHPTISWPLWQDVRRYSSSFRRPKTERRSRQSSRGFQWPRRMPDALGTCPSMPLRNENVLKLMAPSLWRTLCRQPAGIFFVMP
ncbi:hypothetical protein [Parasphaerochaeta coccoides]|uniref:Uncharacterized protein n=1 Tax=Parasphaerochaeta coccoides (strain ATCC BAA-1237 / DSM 17374 / SPN1) TaxID=760011 RepID=F4GL39_PARC1|nr:hypothetical protein [Parasphaerochaeta coccoides]AEC02379.1 hypothetical protein Spico_1165 [Parasphaerochaeta coccoides DSM 17374]